MSIINNLCVELSISIKHHTTFYIAGITHHEEYSLVQELPEEEKQKTLTLKRDKSIAKDQKKLDELKRKLHTDDERKSFHLQIENM